MFAAIPELELIPGSQIQEPRQKLRGKYVANDSRIAELVWHFTKQNVRRRALSGDYLGKNVVAAIGSISTRTRGTARLHSIWQSPAPSQHWNLTFVKNL